MKEKDFPATIRVWFPAFVFLAILSGGGAYAADSSWVGGAGPDWSTAANWSDAAVPSATNRLVFTGTVDLSNTNNLTAGTQFDGITFAAGAGAFTLGGNGINLGGNILNSSASLQTINLALALQQNTVINSGAAGLAVGGTISGGFGFTKKGTGTLTLTAANSYTGTTTVASGTLVLSGANGAITGSPSVRVFSGGMLALNNATNNTNRLGDTAAITLAGGGLSFLPNPGTAATSYSETAGVLNLNAGFSTLATIQAASGQTSTVTFASLNRSAGGVINFTTTGNLGNTRNRILFTSEPTPVNGILPYVTIGVTSNATFGTYVSGTGVLAYVHSATNQSQATWTATENVLLTDSGTVTLSGTRDVNSLVIGTSGAAWTLDLASNKLAVNSGGIVLRSVGSGGKFVTGGTLTAGATNVGGELIISSFSTGSGVNLNISSIIADNGTGAVGLTWAGAVAGSTLVLTGSNTYTGGTWLGGGGVSFMSDASFGAASGKVTVGSSATLAWQTAGTVLNASREIQINEGATATFSAGAGNSASAFMTIEGNITGLGALARINAPNAALRLNGSNSYLGGTFISSGLIEVRNGSALADTGAVVLIPTGGATLNAVLRVIDSETIGSLSGSNSDLGAAALVQIANGQTLTIGGDNTSTTFAGTITGTGGGFTGAVTKIGTGTLTLTGDNLYTGATTITAGTLLINGSGIGSVVAVNANGTLGGSGTTGAITVNANGALAPGNSIGTFSTNNANLVWNGQTSGTFGQMKFELSPTSNSSDLLSLGSGVFDKGTGSVFSFDFLGTGAGGFTYTLVTFGSTDFVLGDFSYTNLASGLTGEFVLNSNNLQFTVVPEPTVAALLFGGVGVVLLFRRRMRGV